jgi:hypothetical protein
VAENQAFGICLEVSVNPLSFSIDNKFGFLFGGDKTNVGKVGV